jgi:hypothetical protein
MGISTLTIGPNGMKAACRNFSSTSSFKPPVNRRRINNVKKKGRNKSQVRRALPGFPEVLATHQCTPFVYEP